MICCDVAKETYHGEPLLHEVMRDNGRLTPPPSLGQIRDHAARGLAALRGVLRTLQGYVAYPVIISEALRGLAAAMDEGVDLSAASGPGAKATS